VRNLAPTAELVLAPQLALVGGPAFVRATIDGLDPPPWVDCLDRPGVTMALIRMRVPRLLFGGPETIRRKLIDMGQQVEVTVAATPGRAVVELAFDELAERVLRVRLAAAGLRL